MRTFKYIGDKAVVTAFGLQFKQNEPINVSDAFIAGKLAGNRFFKEEDPNIATVEFKEIPVKRKKK